MSDLRLSGCQIEKIMSRGEHSDLYRAFSDELQRPVMIKILANRFSAGSRMAKRFLRGGRLAVELEHPNIVRTFAAGEERGRPYMLMEFVDGHSLDRILQVKPRLGWEVAAGIIRQIAKALEAAHERNIVHRAIEPSHIMLSPGGRVVMLGFGLAREADADDVAITADGALVKVTPYSAPEMGDAEPDCRGDLYSLGCVWYHLLTGRPPFSGRDPLELLHAHRTAPVWPIIDLVPAFPSGLAELLDALLIKKPQHRLGSAREVIALIDAALNPDLIGGADAKPNKTMFFSTMEMLAVRRRFTVLVCDDQESTLRCLGETLRRLGMTVLCTRDGKAAVEMLHKRRCDLVMTDLKLPSLWGKTLLESLRAAAPAARLVLTRTGRAAEALYSDPSLKIFACLERPLDLFAVRRTAQEALKEGE